VSDIKLSATARVAATLAKPAAAWGRRHLRTDIVGWLTTRSPDGQLQNSVISYLWEDGTILFYSEPNTPKLRNIEHDPTAAFHLCGDRYGDHGLVIEGLAEIDHSAAPSNVHPAYALKYRAPLAHWRMDLDETAAEFSVPVRIRPTRVRAY
jgi:PPOX class probable F420-dependent enzyme